MDDCKMVTDSSCLEQRGCHGENGPPKNPAMGFVTKTSTSILGAKESKCNLQCLGQAPLYRQIHQTKGMAILCTYVH